MVTKKIEKEIITALQDIGLNNEESLIYYTLVKYGKKGATVRKLNMELKQIERTTIYPILQRLIKNECVVALESSETLKKAKLFIAIEPSKFFNKILVKKKEELKKFEKKAPIFTERLQIMYEREEEYVIDDIDPFIQPYIQPLLKKNWKVSNQIVEKRLNIFGYDVYDYHIDPPYMGPLRGYGGFHIYVFDHVVAISTKIKKDLESDMDNLLDIDNREVTLKEPLKFQYFNVELKFILKLIKRKIQERFLNEFKIKNVIITESEISLLGKTYSSLIVKVKSETDTKYKEAFKSVILPIENKLFFIWAVKHNAMLNILKSVLTVEQIPFNE